MTENQNSASGEPRAAIWRRLIEQIDGYVKANFLDNAAAGKCCEDCGASSRNGEPFVHDQPFGQPCAITLLMQSASALRACADALAPAPDAELREQVEFQRARADKWVAIAERYGSEIEALKARADALAPPEPTDADVLDAMSTFYNGCDFTLHFKADGRVLIGYGCYGVHWNLAQGARYRLSHWLGMNGEQKAVHLHPETLRTLKERKPCARCGGFTFDSLAPPRADALDAQPADTERP